MSFTTPREIPARLNRSQLAVPGIQTRMFEKAANSKADIVFLDLEDAVAPNDKPQARQQVIDAVNQINWGKLLVPKVGTASDVYAIDMLLTQIETAMGFKNRIGLEIMIESALGMQNISKIASSSDRIESLHFGAGDYAASAFGDYSDAQGYIASAKRAAALGCEGKWAIHPSQIDLANEIMGPSQEEITRAENILKAMEEGAKQGKGAVTFEGRMIDYANVRQAEMLVKKADLIAQS